jgi:hypothetical protein
MIDRVPIFSAHLMGEALVRKSAHHRDFKLLNNAMNRQSSEVNIT